jgi:hypothetical protein
MLATLVMCSLIFYFFFDFYVASSVHIDPVSPSISAAAETP